MFSSHSLIILRQLRVLTLIINNQILINKAKCPYYNHHHLVIIFQQILLATEMTTSIRIIISLLLLSTASLSADALQQPLRGQQTSSSGIRRNIITSVPTIATSVLLSNPQISKAGESSGLAAKLSKRDASVLKNSVFNIPPSAQVYPPFMRGEWDVSLRFAGYLFPSQTISKEKVTSNVSIPGFQKCSIAAIADVGRDLTSYKMNISQDKGFEDRAQTLKTSIDAHCNYGAVDNVLYDRPSNANRLSINFVKNRTRNAERIELFCNARESELVPNPNDANLSIFVNSEYIRQVTFSLSQEFGVARQVIGNYAHFWTWREQPDGKTMTGNVLTACYLDPQDAMFFQEPSKPVAVYSHQITAKKV